jgi:ATP-dependent helicase/nuclease subunit B
MPATEVPDVLHAAIHDARWRRPRNKDSHARVAIWGVLEARLQRLDGGRLAVTTL